MDDDNVIRFLMAVAGYVAHLHAISRETQPSPSNSGEKFHDGSIPWMEEGFARWMGYRGEEEQEREIKNQRERSKKGT